MKLLLWGAALAGGYYLYTESKKKKEAAKPVVPGVTGAGLLAPDDPEGSLYVKGGGLYLDTQLPGDVLIELEGLGSCCHSCRMGGPCCG